MLNTGNACARTHLRHVARACAGFPIPPHTYRKLSTTAAAENRKLDSARPTGNQASANTWRKLGSRDEECAVPQEAPNYAAWNADVPRFKMRLTQDRPNSVPWWRTYIRFELLAYPTLVP